ncbi:MAG: prolipoprotein diacylglyceryl transferase family protein [Woeseiaceae bacterium]
MYSHFDSFTWVTPFGLFFLAAIMAAWWLARRNAVSTGIDGSHVDLLIPVTIIVGIAGGVALSLLMPMDRLIAGEMMQTEVRVRLFGMLAAGAVALFAYSRRADLSFRRMLDVFALPTLAGLMIHRVGCFLAGCCWGDLVANGHGTALTPQIQTLPALHGLSNGVQFPPGSLPFEQHVASGLIEPNAVASLPVYPVQLYESALLLLVLLVLWRYPWKQRPTGVLAVLTVSSYALLRFVVEYLRADGAIVLGNLTVTQLQCLFLFLSVALLPGMLRQARTGGSTVTT